MFTSPLSLYVSKEDAIMRVDIPNIISYEKMHRKPLFYNQLEMVSKRSALIYHKHCPSRFNCLHPFTKVVWMKSFGFFFYFSACFYFKVCFLFVPYYLTSVSSIHKHKQLISLCRDPHIFFLTAIYLHHLRVSLFTLVVY